MATVVRQDWYESEAGWGQRPDGCSIHLSESDRAVYCKEYWASMPEQVPDEYSKEDGEPFLADLDDNHILYKQLVESENGIRLYDRAEISQLTRS